MTQISSATYKLILIVICLTSTACNLNPARSDGSAASNIDETPVTSNADTSELHSSLPVILFTSGSTRLDAQARRQLREIANALNETTVVDQNIIVNGHSDTRGDASTNLMLSRHRAEAVSRELMLNGVKGSRLIIHALGESNPLFDEMTATGDYDAHAADLNRRVELSLQ